MSMTTAIRVVGRPVWAEVSLQAIGRNLRRIRRHIGPKPQILAVVKSNAYGLGAVPVAKALEKAGAERFGVTCANEGVELRESGIRKPILVLTGFWPGEEKRFIANRLTPSVTRLEDVRALERVAKSARVKSRLRFHLKINTGMNRLGLLPSEIDAFAGALADCRNIEL
jgi:alanine racemase